MILAHCHAIPLTKWNLLLMLRDFLNKTYHELFKQYNEMREQAVALNLRPKILWKKRGCFYIKLILIVCVFEYSANITVEMKAAVHSQVIIRQILTGDLRANSKFIQFTKRWTMRSRITLHGAIACEGISDLHTTSHHFTPESLLDWFPCSAVLMTAGDSCCKMLINPLKYETVQIATIRYSLILLSNYFHVQFDYVQSSIDDPCAVLRELNALWLQIKSMMPNLLVKLCSCTVTRPASQCGLRTPHLQV